MIEHLEDKNIDKLFRTIFAHASVGMALLSPGLIFEQVNDSFYRIAGHTKEELEKMKYTDLVFPEDVIRFKELLAAMANGKIEGFVIEKRYVNRSSKLCWVRNNVSLVKSPEGAILHIIILAEDIHDSKAAEDKIKETQDRLRFITEIMPQKVWTADSQGHFSYFNRQWIDYTGLDLEHLNRGNVWQRIIHPEDLDESLRVWNDSMIKGDVFQVEHRLKNKEGEYRWHLTRGIPEKDTSGRLIRWVGTNTDVHDQKMSMQSMLMAEKELRIMNSELHHKKEQLFKTTDELDNFIYTASHDLKTPIANIEGILNEIMVHPCYRDAELRMLLEMMNTSSEKLKKTIKDLTEINKTGRLEAEDVEDISFEEALSDVRTDLSNFIKKHHATIECDFSKAPILRFSRKNLKSILYNLISNAIKFKSSDRKPEVFIETVQEQEYLVLLVHDNGVGIRESHKSKVFKMFKRFHDDVEGAGVGLSIVSKIIDKNGGKIEIESEVGKGTTFKVFLKA